MARTIITFTSFDENGAEITRTLPARWTTCMDCMGSGWGTDLDASECEECSGTGEVAVLIREICNPKVRAEYDAMMAASDDLALAV